MDPSEGPRQFGNTVPHNKLNYFKCSYPLYHKETVKVNMSLSICYRVTILANVHFLNGKKIASVGRCSYLSLLGHEHKENDTEDNQLIQV